MSNPLASGSLEPYLPNVYRFGLLMTGKPADAVTVLRQTVERAARDGITDLRDTRRVKRWLFAEARRQANAQFPQVDPEEAAVVSTAVSPEGEVAAPVAAEAKTPEVSSDLARRFYILPESERCALALFYLYLFDPTELAEVMEIPPADLAPLLTHARDILAKTP